MPRIFRILPEEGVLHILTRGNNRQRVFRDNVDYKTYLDFLKTYKRQNNLLVYHYCIMPNHVHLVVEVTSESTLARFIKQLNLAYLYHYKKRYDYDGHLWQGRYKSLLISKDEYLIACGRYIEFNPVKAGIVKDPREYNWSSYNVYGYGKKDGITDCNPLYKDWGKEEERQKNYRKDAKGKQNKISMNLNARFMGSDEFIKKMEVKYKVSNIKANRGRPKK